MQNLSQISSVNLSLSLSIIQLVPITVIKDVIYFLCHTSLVLNHAWTIGLLLIIVLRYHPLHDPTILSRNTISLVTMGSL